MWAWCACGLRSEGMVNMKGFRKSGFIQYHNLKKNIALLLMELLI